MNRASQRGFAVPELLLPKPGIDLTKWAVIAVDQFTSEPDYWDQVAAIAGDSPSTFHLILPEICLGTPEESRRIESIRSHMREYLASGCFVEQHNPVLVERMAGGRTRHGVMLALDLEQYDYERGATSLIRATEGTILERIPPRVRIRSGAPLEIPHILVLIDDAERTVIEPLVAQAAGMRRLYDFELMLGSGHLRGYDVASESLQRQMMASLERLAEPARFASRYGLPAGMAPLLFAVGDGNHSLATAKSIWEQIKGEVPADHPARYALVEVENIHDEGLEFEPILRVVFDRPLRPGRVPSWNSSPGAVRVEACEGSTQMAALVDGQTGPEHAFGIMNNGGYGVAYVEQPPANLPVGTLQAFLDDWGKRGGYDRIDYVHGEDVAERLGRQPGNAGFYVPSISKSEFFKTVILDGALPRKTFSMGEARDKRFYFEARRITEAS